MNWTNLSRPPWRTIVPGVCLLVLLIGGFLLWSPGLDVRDGRHDLGRNGIWIGHGWLGGDQWFTDYHKEDQIPKFRDEKRVREFAEALRLRHVTDVFPHLCPATSEGTIPPLDPAQTERFLSTFDGFRVIPWVGGPNRTSVILGSEAWRKGFVSEIRALFERHPRFAGVHLNIEPLPSGDADYLRLLEEIKAALPSGKVLSVAAYPPPTRWQPIPDVHWDEGYFRQVAKKCDQLVVMMYDTALRVPKLYQRLMADWTEEVLQWSEGKAVLLGVPTYDDAHTEYHRPDVENLPSALRGIHEGLSRRTIPENYQGVAIYCEWETDLSEWEIWRERFLRK